MLFFKTYSHTPLSSNKNRTRCQISTLFTIWSKLVFNFFKDFRNFLIAFSFLLQFIFHPFMKLAFLVNFLSFDLILKTSQTIQIFDNILITSFWLELILYILTHILGIFIIFILRNSKDKQIMKNIPNVMTPMHEELIKYTAIDVVV